MHVAGKCTAPGSRLAADQYRSFVPGELLHALAQTLHQLAASHGCSQRRQQFTGRLRLLARRIECPFDGAQQFCERQRLLDEIERAEPCCLHRRIDGAVPGHDDDRTVQIAVFRPFAQQRDAVGIGHPDIEQDQIELRCGPRVTSGTGVAGNRHAVAFVRQDVLNQRPNVGLVVDYQYLGICHACSLLFSARPGARAMIFSRAASLSGNRILIIAPPSLRLLALIEPTCSSTSFFTIASPRPVPLVLVVT